MERGEKTGERPGARNPILFSNNEAMATDRQRKGRAENKTQAEGGAALASPWCPSRVVPAAGRQPPLRHFQAASTCSPGRGTAQRPGRLGA